MTTNLPPLTIFRHDTVWKNSLEKLFSFKIIYISFQLLAELKKNAMAWEMSSIDDFLVGKAVLIVATNSHYDWMQWHCRLRHICYTASTHKYTPDSIAACVHSHLHEHTTHASIVRQQKSNTRTISTACVFTRIYRQQQQWRRRDRGRENKNKSWSDCVWLCACSYGLASLSLSVLYI